MPDRISADGIHSSTMSYCSCPIALSACNKFQRDACEVHMTAPTSFHQRMPDPPEWARQWLHEQLPKNPATCLARGLLSVAMTGSMLAAGHAAAPDIPAVDLAASPLLVTKEVEKPAMVIALSDEYTIVGSQYVPVAGTGDATYTTAKEYLGYYDAGSCYRYNDNPGEALATGQTRADYKRFDRTGPATARRCTDAFSGNFLNWASGSAMDMYRLVLSGGDRYIDTAKTTTAPALTILQRAVLPSDAPACGNGFPAKRLDRDGGGAGAYWGAVPASMIAAAAGNGIYVANIQNRIHFGKSRAGACDNASGETLGTTSDPAVGPIEHRLARDGFYDGDSDQMKGEKKFCTLEGQFCRPRAADLFAAGIFAAGGTLELWYGAETDPGNELFNFQYTWKTAPVWSAGWWSTRGISCSNDVFGDPVPGRRKECFYRAYRGSWQPANLNSDGYFYARVQVCNVDAAGRLVDQRDYDFCARYPDGSYKPTGVIQRYSDQMRFAAFSYLLDSTPSSYPDGRYGGVLRAPMKYAGPKTYDSNGRPAGSNAKTEWDGNTGVLKPNPESNPVPAISGIINYLNRFGRNTTRPGEYKTYDPTGELHYEALRYLQGLPPSAAAVTGITDAMRNGFPVYTTWEDPYGAGRNHASDYSCVKSNILIIGDEGFHDGNRLPTPSAEDNIPDIDHWRRVVHMFETGGSFPLVDGQGVTRRTANPNGRNTQVPSTTYVRQIMGSAYWARTHDIRGTAWREREKQRPGLRVKTFVFDVNQSGSSNDLGRRRTSNPLFLAAKYGGFETDPGNPAGRPYNTWGNPFKDNQGDNTNAVWQRADGEALSYYFFDPSKSSPARDILGAFDDIFKRASGRTDGVAGGSLSTGSKFTESSVSYSARFDTSNWSGDIVARRVRQNASRALVVDDAAPPLWSAAQRLDGMPSPNTDRKIFVGKGGATANPVASEFRWTAIGPALQAHLNRGGPQTPPDGRGEARLAYLRGDRSNEAGSNPFRVRASLLGDIVNSNVSYSAAPARKSFTGAGYAQFRSTYGSRPPAVFAGANDGMLHAFHATTGDELFAYIPSWLVPNLSALTAPDFVNNHQSYVDAPSVVAQARVGSGDTRAADWKTVLVSGTGGGGSGVFALDVSDPANFSAANVMWEFTRADDPDLGQVVGSPKIMKIKTSGTAATETFRWFAVVGSGVNNYRPDSDNRFSPDGRPALFLLALDKPAGTAWSLGSNYFKVSIPIDTAVARTQPTGLANFSALYGARGEMTDIYLGDLHGALWRLQFTGKPTTDWNMNKLSFFYQGPRTNPVAMALYKARTGDVDPAVQPIVAAPTLLVGPTMGGVESFYVVVGTGKYLELGDTASMTKQTVYAIHDNGLNAADSTQQNRSIISGRGRLQRASVDTTSKQVTVSPFTWGRPTSDADTSRRSGWYFDLPGAGERIDQAALDTGFLSVAINSKIPAPAGTGCSSNALGSGNQYRLKVAEASGSYVTFDSGLTGSPVLLFSDTETKVSAADSAGQRIRTTVWRPVAQKSGDVAGTIDGTVNTEEPAGRLSWRQIFNYLDLKNARSGSR